MAPTRFDDAAKALKDGLIASGFEGQDVADLVVERLLLPPTPSETTQPADAPVIATLSDPLATALPLDVIDAVTWNPATRELTVEKKLTPDQETAIVPGPEMALPGKPCGWQSTAAPAASWVRRERAAS